MQRNNIGFGLLLVFLLFTGCIEPFVPRIESGAEDVFVVSGEVTDQPGYQYVDISRASSLKELLYVPVSGCLVNIEDDKGNTFNLEEIEAGKYRVWMNEENLGSGISYRVRVTTPSGDEILSDFDRMSACAAIDSVHYERKEMIAPNTGKNLNGLQFYVDFHGTDSDSRYYRWTADETWEYHAPLPMTYYYDGTTHKIWPPDYTYSKCWSTLPAKSIFTLTTSNLVSNSFKMLPLHYVDNTTNRLLIRYSVLITQHALSDAAYVFWEQLRINNEKQGNLYEKQPLSIKGNLHNTTHPGIMVLGFFGASSVSRKRIFVDGITDMDITDGSFCSPEELGMGGWKNIMPWEYPVYFVYINFQLYTLQKTCTDCRALGGTINKPDFWPN